MSRSDITVRLAGESGEGVISGGDILTNGAARTGYWAYTFRTYPSEIKGGPCMYQVRMGCEKVLSRGNTTDLLVCFNQEGFDREHNVVSPEGYIVYEESSVEVTPEFKDRAHPAPLEELAKEAGGSIRGKNMVAIGTVCGLLDLDTTKIEELILKRYAHKGEVGESNIKALKAGVESVKEGLGDKLKLGAPKLTGADDRLLLSGNQAICLGALQSGLNFFAGYPITPASDILEWLTGQLPKFDGLAMQTEDEISAMSAIIGASYAGNKSMTATSGPGLSLMAELIGLAGMAEIPTVIIDSQRAGPSTGMPTKTEQSDLNFALYGSHGDAPRVVMAPTSVDDCFTVMIEAFNAAECYQVPVIILTDQSLSHRLETVPRPNLKDYEVVDRIKPDESLAGNDYERYADSESGISPMSVPGGKGAYVSTGIEHDAGGNPQYEPELRKKMMDKRFHKLEPLATSGRYSEWGPKDADIGILGWGSTEGAAQEASKLAADEGITVAGLFPRILMPLPVDMIKEWAEGKQRIFVPEVNYAGQFARLLRSDVGIEVESITRITGLPFTAIDIFENIKQSQGAKVG